ncbi:MAG TPA: hypothetical protein VK607_03965 [Kofleriaceae bacterium]|nr:hypothetical protein [Kofleriaceae bacterium]HMG56021.1 hypothetical protein [Kofleriaceae bacterium]
MIAIRGMAGLEHAQADGSFTMYQPGESAPPRIRAGDRLRLRLEVDDGAWLYAVSALRKADHRKLGAWGPGECAAGGVRMPWPGGHVLTADDAAMTVLFVIASRDELPWARDLTHTDCSSLIGVMPAVPPVTLCDHLHGLMWKIPPRIRGMVPPEVDAFDEAGLRIPAIVSQHHGESYTAIEWQFKPRP